MASVTEPRAMAAGVAFWRRGSLRFYFCVGLLGLVAASMQSVEHFLKVRFRKEALPLKRSLRLFDPEVLGPRYVRDVKTDLIESPGPDMIESLGTEEFLQIFLADTQKPAQDATRLAHLMVSYYTGQPDKVPHVPERCYIAGGYDPADYKTIRVPVAGVGAPGDELEVRAVGFRRGPELATVLYLFHTNGSFETTEDGVRGAMLKNVFQRYAYYAKIEASFMDEAGRRAGPEASEAAVGPLLEHVLPVLLRDYFDLERFASEDAGPPAPK